MGGADGVADFVAGTKVSDSQSDLRASGGQRD
jgi:hypothetical protein